MTGGTFLGVALAGGVGACARFWLDRGVQKILDAWGDPAAAKLGIFVVNAPAKPVPIRSFHVLSDTGSPTPRARRPTTHAESAPSRNAPTTLTVSVDHDRKRPRTGDAFATSSSPARAAVPATPPTKTANQSGTRNLVMSPTVRPSSYPPGEADPGRRPRPRTLGA